MTYCIAIDDLLNEQQLTTIIETYGASLGATTFAAAGSLFIKKYALLTIPRSFEHFGIQQRIDWWYGAQLDFSTMQLIDGPSSTTFTGCWKTRLLREHFAKLITLVSKLCKIPARILWENVVIRLNRVFRAELAAGNPAIEQHFHALIAHDWFPNNPLTALMHIENFSPIRKTCCRYYQTAAKTHCTICPLNNIK